MTTLPWDMDSRTGSFVAGKSCWILLVGVLLVATAAPCNALLAQSRPADSLNLIERYRANRYRLLVRQFLSRGPVRALPPEPLSTSLDSLYPSLTWSAEGTKEGDNDRPFPVDDVRPVQHLERAWFRDEFGGTNWSFLGPGLRLTFLDTTLTRELRARLQARFGDPTKTVAELDFEAWRDAPDSSRAAPSQFEYWFVVNDSIPVRVTDVNGPRERGLIVSTDRTYRDRLHALREGLLGPLQKDERAPYVDYYYADEQRRWYRAGFDGQSFFLEPVPRYDIVPGRRPRLDTVRTEADAPTTTSSSPSP